VFSTASYDLDLTGNEAADGTLKPSPRGPKRRDKARPLYHAEGPGPVFEGGSGILDVAWAATGSVVQLGRDDPQCSRNLPMCYLSDLAYVLL